MTRTTHYALKEHLWLINSNKEYDYTGIKIHIFKKSIKPGYRFIKYSVINDQNTFCKFSEELRFDKLESIELLYNRNKKLKSLIGLCK